MNRNLENVINGMFTPFTVYRPCYIYNPHVEENRIFSMCLDVDVSGNTFEIPVYRGLDVINTMEQEGRDCRRVVVQIWRNRYDEVYPKLSTSVFRRIMDYTSECGMSLRKIPFDGTVYYGARGLMLDKDFRVLMMSTISMAYNEETDGLTADRMRLYLNPCMITGKGKLEKWIRNTLIPYLCESGVYTSWNSYYVVNNICRYFDRMIPEIVIDDSITERFVRFPAEPDVAHSNELMNILLEQNIDNLMGLTINR